jgi:hypothetical protein
LVRRGLVAEGFVVHVYVGCLRRKIETPFGVATIETVRGVGYRLLGDAKSRPTLAESCCLSGKASVNTAPPPSASPTVTAP